MWHQYNSMEMVLQEINANLATLNVSPCSNPDLMQSVIRDKSSYLHLSKLDFTRKKDGSIYTFTSKQKYNSKPFIEARVDCSAVVKNGDVVPVVQLKSMHRLMFFSAKIPNLRPGAEPIEIIPSSVDFVSSKSATVREYWYVYFFRLISDDIITLPFSIGNTKRTLLSTTFLSNNIASIRLSWEIVAGRTYVRAYFESNEIEAL